MNPYTEALEHKLSPLERRRIEWLAETDGDYQSLADYEDCPVKVVRNHITLALKRLGISITTKCDWCGKEFVPMVHNNIYCKDPCDPTPEEVYERNDTPYCPQLLKAAWNRKGLAFLEERCEC